MALAAKTFLYELDPATSVATLTLNRPDRLNALTFDVYQELREMFQALDTEPGVRAILLTGAGKGFCSGGDVDLIIAKLLEYDHAGLLRFTRMTGALIQAIRSCSRPVVAALNGTVAGAGAVIASACDVRIASDQAKIAFLFTKVGLAGADMGASWLLPRLIGWGRASELLLTGDFIDAQEAERIGLYNEVVPAERLLPEARAFAARLASGPSLAMATTKRLLNQEAALDLVSSLEAEAQAQAGCMQDPNFREFYDAFRAKRAPRFT